MPRVFFPVALLLSLLVASFSLPAYAGAWLQPPDHGYTSATLAHFTSDHYWDAQGRSHPQPRFTKWEIQPYAEYGLTRDTTLGGSVFLQANRQGNTRTMGLADPELFSRHRVWEGDLWGEHRVVSLQPLLKLPSQFTGDPTPRGGTPSTDAELSLLYGQSYPLFSAEDYLDTRLGYRARSLNLQQQLRVDMALALHPWGAWSLTPALRYIGSMQPPVPSRFSEDGTQDYRLLKGELALAYQFPDGHNLRATYFSHLTGQQAGAGQGIAIGYAATW